MYILKKWVFSFFVSCIGFNSLYAVDELFDPMQAAKEEAAAWKDYYNNDITGLVQHLSHLVIIEFRINQITAWTTVIPQLAESAKLFKDLPHSTTKETYTQVVLPHLTTVYEAIKDALQGSWDAKQAAETELDWWIYRRENDHYNPEIVGKRMADLYRLIYGTNDENHFARAGYLRAVAARYRDVCQAEWHHVEETDWAIIESILEKSYQELISGIKSNKTIKTNQVQL